MAPSAPAGAAFARPGTMKRRHRLRRRRDFDRVMRGRRVHSGRALVAFASPSPTGEWRVGIAVSRRLRGAVSRNRVRRRLREAARARLLPNDSDRPGVGIGYDVVLIGRPASMDVPMAVLEEEAAGVRARLRRP